MLKCDDLTGLKWNMFNMCELFSPRTWFLPLPHCETCGIDLKKVRYLAYKIMSIMGVEVPRDASCLD